jgi:hypothetical protein
MTENKSLLVSGWGRVVRNKRYIFWFWLLNLTLAEFGTSAFRKSAHTILDHSLYSDRLTHGFSLGVMGEMFARPEFGQTSAASMPSMYFAFLFFMATAIFLPGVILGYSSTYRLPREEFFRSCGRNLWRFIRLMIVAAIVMGIFSGILFGINGALVKKAGESTNELLGFQTQMTGLGIIFLIMTILRIWFDLAEVDIVLHDQRAVRKSLAVAFKHTFGSLFRLLASYVLSTAVAAIVLVGGLWCWLHFVPSTSVMGAFLLAQIILFLLLIPRFWQRGIAVSYWQQRMLVPVVAPASISSASSVPATSLPEISPAAATGV